MGRRKQFCPQKTGLGEGGPNDVENEANNEVENKDSSNTNEEPASPIAVTDEPDNGAAQIEEPAPPPPAAEKQLPASKPAKVPTPVQHHKQERETKAKSSTPAASSDETLANLLRNPLLNPSLLTSMSMNPAQLQQLNYALQLAQLHAAQQQLLLSPNPSIASLMRKRKFPGEDESDAESAPPSSMGDVLNLSSRRSPTPPPGVKSSEKRTADSPLDLSGSPVDSLAGRSPMKMSKVEQAPSMAKLNPWANVLPFLNPFITGATGGAAADPAAAAAAALSRFPPTPPASSPSPSSVSSVSAAAFLPKVSPGEKNPLERMSEIAKTGCPPKPPSSGRHSAWQSQWISRGPENAKDIFKCVCCKSSYPSMGELTRHMAETGHYQPAAAATASGVAASPTGALRKNSPDVSARSASSSAAAAAAAAAAAGERAQIPTSVSSSSAAAKRDILKDHLPIPRKLVRGQDVWLGKGEEQTKHILKCMQCSQSFRSLSDLTQHMTETQHFKKVISQDQISALKSSSSPNSSSSSPSQSPRLQHPPSSLPMAKTSSTNSDQINTTVLTCKVCGQGFPTLKLLGEHVVKSNHFGDALGTAAAPGAGLAALRSSQSQASRGGLPGLGMGLGAPVAMDLDGPVTKATSGRKSKSLPVKTLLELERAQKSASAAVSSSSPTLATSNTVAAAAAGLGVPVGSLPCDKCGESIPMVTFIQHSVECSLKLKHPLVATSPPSSASAAPDNIRPESAKSTTSSIASNEDARSAKSSKSIIGSLEDMVNHNFGKREGPVTMSASSFPASTSVSGDGGAASDRSSVSPHRSSPATPHKAPPAASPGAKGDEGSSNSNVSNGKEASSSSNTNPLAALQSLCESTVESKAEQSMSPKARSAALTAPTPGSILAFSWACNQAVVDESVLKCHLCEAPFVSKGAYRHHLSKVHFINGTVEPCSKGGNGNGNGSGGTGGGKDDSNKGSGSKGPRENSGAGPTTSSGGSAGSGGPGSQSGGTSSNAANGSNQEEESQNKYHKYAEMAKQLSSQTKTQLSTIA